MMRWKPLATAVAALLLAALLNADELVRTAERQPLGWRRSVLVDVTSGVRAVADLTRLSAPRSAMEDAIHGDDATAVEGASASGSNREARADDPLRVVLVGDSVMQAIGEAFLAAVDESGSVDATLEFHVATGLARPDYFDWPARLRELVAVERPDALVVLFGAQDTQPMQADAGVLKFGTASWAAEYRSRVARLMSSLATGGRSVFWLGQPVMRSGELSEKIRALNAIYAAEADRHDGVTFVDLWKLTATPDGGFTSSLRAANGDLVSARAADGVHFAPSGGDIVARHVLDLVREERGP